MECLGDLVQAERQSAARPSAALRRQAEGPLARLDTGHYPMLSEPEALARLIVEDNQPRHE